MKQFPTYIFVILGSLLFSSVKLQAQKPIAVESNDNVTTTFFFPSNIAKVISPAVNFNFQYEQGTNMGSLKGSKGRPSNLSVITDLGNIYSFTLSYSEKVEKFNFILSADKAVGKINHVVGDSPDKTSRGIDSDTAANNDTPKPINNKPIEQVKKTTKAPDASVQSDNALSDTTVAISANQNKSDDLYDVDREEYYRIFCENNYLQKTIVKRSFRQHKKIVLRLNNILVDRKEKYFVLQIENNSKKEYKVYGLSFFRKINVGLLEEIMNPVYTFNLQETIDPRSINELVYVFKNFNISNKELITVVLLEAESGHVVKLPLDHLFINHPSN